MYSRSQTRREFLARGAATLAASTLLRSGVLALSGPASPRTDGRTLVLVELTGGNDGLNTVIPFEQAAYARLRPTLRFGKDALLNISDSLALAPQLPNLTRLFKQGQLTIVQGVGMKDPDRSHFTSLDRWHTGDPHGRGGTGWLARGLSSGSATNPPISGIALGDRSLPLILRGASGPVIACSQLQEIMPPRKIANVLKSRGLQKLDGLWGEPRDRELAIHGREFLESLESVDRIKKTPALSGSGLGGALDDILRTLLGSLHVPAFFVRMGGFDTHARQKSAHADLLSAVDRYLSVFLDALRKHRLEKKVLVMVYSEFGRRAAENGSAGTDHGAAGLVLFLGAQLPGGIHGAAPDLDNLVDGDVSATTDFRRPLAQCLKHLRHADPVQVLGRDGRPLF